MAQIDSTRSNLPWAAIPLLKYLDYHGKKTQKQLIVELELPVRTVRYAVTRLLEENYIQRIPNLEDMRSVFYQISPEICNVTAICENHQSNPADDRSQSIYMLE